MHVIIVLLFAILIMSPFINSGEMSGFERDDFETSVGKVAITFIGHGTLMLEWDGKVIHVDPYSKLADYATLPKADLILITHDHFDHLDLEAISKIKTEQTVTVLTETCAEKFAGGAVMKNGEGETFRGIPVSAVSAYNLIHKRPNGQPFHSKGDGNGYILTFGNTKIYIAGDTENIPEMAELKGITIAFLPMNLPYTMTPEQAAEAAISFKPKILYPYHRGETDADILIELLGDYPEIEVRIRKLK